MYNINFTIETSLCIPPTAFSFHCTLNATTPNYGTTHWHPQSVPMAQLAYHHSTLTKSARPKHKQIQEEIRNPTTTKFLTILE